MPWSIQQRDGRYCVVKDADGEVEGCHDARADAVKQQAALYAQEGRTAGLEIEVPEFFLESDPAVSAALVASLEAMTRRLVTLEAREDKIAEVLTLLANGQSEDRETLRSLVASLSSFSVTVPEPVVNVTVPTPEVNVHLPSRRSIKLERDPFGTISGASVEEE